MMCLKVIYTGLIKTEIGNLNSDGYFHGACAIWEKSCRKVLENLVEHQIIKMIRKFNNIICRFFAPNSQDNAFSLLHVWGAKKRQMMLLFFLFHIY